MKMEQIVNFGVIVIIIGFLIVFFGTLKGTNDKDSNAKVAVGGFIGFIPFGFGNDKDMVKTILLISAVLFLVWLIFSFKLGK